MCELFAMSSRLAATINFSLEEFARHGGMQGPHKDGWGIAFYEEYDALILRAPEPASESQLVKYIEKNSFHSNLVLSHIRKATHGEVCLKNTHPFSREIGGRLHVFAHNGEFPGVRSHPDYKLNIFRAIGSTDSEHAFCLLMDCLTDVWLNPTPPSLEQRLSILVTFTQRMEHLSPDVQANFLYSDGEYLFVHGHVRRQASDGMIRAPGLYTLCRSCHPNSNKRPSPITGLRMQTFKHDGNRQYAALAASVPLTDESWEPLLRGEIVVMQDGKIIKRVPPPSL
ncbi:glutamine amidotransferase, class-II [Magnetococcus marinus MC-1]|uniref:Glutamine amidotransferase, class-II n=1 Tax=Magnetococcus marinus (strain ATCC BAA-1437 / JCM 17883 / MC-1) TaxID=156889 RepID=A0L605_MAGMM|nr:class II glutamine amidotransferase [Magnetococcus marinus]ABK43398.1 glutamine amidotransferase, class-II [Magnetococcus marinus MC-1]